MGDTEDRLGELGLEQAHQISVLECTAALVSKSAKELASPTTSSETFATWANFFIAANPFQYPGGL